MERMKALLETGDIRPRRTITRPSDTDMPPNELTRRQVVRGTGALVGAGAAGCTAVEPPRGESGGNPEAASDVTGTERFVELYDDIAGGVVELSLPAPEEPFQERGGSGFLIGTEQLVTNAHVVGSADSVDVRFRDHDWREGSILATDPHSDLAIIDVEDVPEYAHDLSLGTDIPEIGLPVMAIGSPFGFGGSASTGIVSGVNRSLPSPSGFSIPAAIQTDAAVNPGSSGGPLVNLDRDVMGVVFAGTGQNVGFAISAPLAERVVPVLRAGDEYEHAYVGVVLVEITPRLADANELDRVYGVYVDDVLGGSPADGVLRGTTDQESVVGGDVIVGIDGADIPHLNALSTHLALETAPDDTIEISVIRNGEEEAVGLTLGTRPEVPGESP